MKIPSVLTLKTVLQANSEEKKHVVLEKTWYLPHHPMFDKNKPKKF